MHDAVKDNIEKRAKRVIAALKANNMEGWYLPDAAGVREFVEKLIPEGATVANGGSMTLAETGVMDLLASGRYEFLDRTGLAGEELGKLYRRVFSADWYLASANAITEAGEIYNVDGNSNRVAAICYGPRSVIMVVGCNKIVRDIPAAVIRVKRRSAPANVARLRCDTPCAKTGSCAGIQREGMTDGCGVDGRICCNYLVSARQRVPGRIKVILVGEELGY